MMTRRTIAVAALACLLCGCSGQDGETAGGGAESEAGTEQSVAEASAPGDSLSGRPTGADAEQAPDSTSAEGAPDSADQGPVDPEDAPATLSEGVGAAAEETASAVEPVDEGGGGAVSSAYGLRVLRAYVCKGIEQSEPAEAGKSFIPEEDGVLRLCCFSEIAGARGTQTVYHVWRWGEREMARVELEVRSARWRTWSTKRILDEWRGEWHVDIVDADGVVLTRLDFSVE
jgi:hypothetical protein